MVDVFLYGELGEMLGDRWAFKARSPAEVFDAIDANTDGRFLKYMWEKEKRGLKYYVFLDKDPISENQLLINLESKEEMHVVPAVEGAGDMFKKGTFFHDLFRDEMFQIGAIAIGAGLALKGLGSLPWLDSSAWYPGEGTWGELMGSMGDISIELGISLVMQGMINVLQSDPDHPDEADNPQPGTESFVFDNPENTVIQGAVVPVGYGRLRVGSHIVSTALMNTRLANFNSVDIEEVENSESESGQSDTAQHVDVNRTIPRVTEIDEV